MTLAAHHSRHVFHTYIYREMKVLLNTGRAVCFLSQRTYNLRRGEMWAGAPEVMLQGATRPGSGRMTSEATETPFSISKTLTCLPSFLLYAATSL